MQVCLSAPVSIGFLTIVGKPSAFKQSLKLPLTSLTTMCIEFIFEICTVFIKFFCVDFVHSILTLLTKFLLY